MEFVDYKCLESLLIEGENSIAVEGIGSTVYNAVKSIFNAIHTFIKTIIRVITGIISKLKSKKAVKPTNSVKTNNNNNVNVSSDTSNTIPVDSTVKNERITYSSINKDKLKPAYADGNYLRFNSILNSIDNITATCGIMINDCSYILKPFFSNESEDEFTEIFEEMKEDIEKYMTELNQEFESVSDYNSNNNYLTEDQRDSWIDRCKKTKSNLEKLDSECTSLESTLGKYTNVKPENINKIKQGLSVIAKAISVSQDTIIKVSTMVNNSEIISD